MIACSEALVKAALARVLSRNDKHTNQNKCKVGHSCLMSMQMKQKGGNGKICLVSMRPDVGIFIAEGEGRISMLQVEGVSLGR